MRTNPTGLSHPSRATVDGSPSAATARLWLPVLSLLLSTACVSVRTLDEAVPSPLTGRYLSVGDHRIHIEEMGNGEPVLLVHGFGGSTYSWRKIQPELASEYRTVAVDLLGFGYSERPPDRAAYGRTEQVELLTGLLDGLGWKSAHLVGHSYGGGLVMTLAHRYPRRVRSMVLIDSTAPDYAERRRHFLGRRWFGWLFLRGVALRPGFVRRTLERSFFDDAKIDDALISEYLQRLRIEGVVNAYVGLTVPRSPPGPDWEVDLEQLEQPTLIVWGENDPLIDVEGARRQTARIPRSRFVAIPECGHIPIEEKPEVVAREILRFLEGLGVNGGRASMAAGDLATEPAEGRQPEGFRLKSPSPQALEPARTCGRIESPRCSPARCRKTSR